MVPSLPCFLWNSKRLLKGNGQIMSLFKTKNGESSFPKTSRAKANGPAI